MKSFAAATIAAHASDGALAGCAGALPSVPAAPGAAGGDPAVGAISVPGAVATGRPAAPPDGEGCTTGARGADAPALPGAVAGIIASTGAGGFGVEEPPDPSAEHAHSGSASASAARSRWDATMSNLRSRNADCDDAFLPTPARSTAVARKRNRPGSQPGEPNLRHPRI